MLCSRTTRPPGTSAPAAIVKTAAKIRDIVRRIEQHEIERLRRRRRACRKNRSRMIAHASSAPQRATFSRERVATRRSRSTNVTCDGAAAQRLDPSAPVPAKPSSTRVPSTAAPSTLNRVSRRLSDVGRTAGPDAGRRGGGL